MPSVLATSPRPSIGRVLVDHISSFPSFQCAVAPLRFKRDVCNERILVGGLDNLGRRLECGVQVTILAQRVCGRCLEERRNTASGRYRRNLSHPPSRVSIRVRSCSKFSTTKSAPERASSSFVNEVVIAAATHSAAFAARTPFRESSITKHSPAVVSNPRIALSKMSGSGFGFENPDESMMRSKLVSRPSKERAARRLRGVAEVANAIRYLVRAHITNSLAPPTGTAMCSNASNSSCLIRTSSSASRFLSPIDCTTSFIIVSSGRPRSEEHTSELQSLRHLVCRLLLE